MSTYITAGLRSIEGRETPRKITNKSEYTWAFNASGRHESFNTNQLLVLSANTFVGPWKYFLGLLFPILISSRLNAHWATISI